MTIKNASTPSPSKLTRIVAKGCQPRGETPQFVIGYRAGHGPPTPEEAPAIA
jgi:hypothetical protein